MSILLQNFKKQNNNKQISSIIDKDGIILTEQRDINRYISPMFKNKFRAEEPQFATQKFEDFMKKYNIVLARIDSKTNQELTEPYVEIEI